MSMSLADIRADVMSDGSDEKVLKRKDVVERPTNEVRLGSLDTDVHEYVKVQKDPTDDLVFLPRCKADWGLGTSFNDFVQCAEGYLIWCADTEEIWYAPDKRCLDANFIYREDLTIHPVTSVADAESFYAEKTADLRPGVCTCKVQYILDNPGNETYELYHDSNYPTVHYGKATPTGMFIHRYQNRFHRDMAILSLDAEYSNSSHKEAAKLTAKSMGVDEAIIVSDGAWLKNTSSCSYFYLDNTSVLKMVEGTIPSDPDQAVLISEINGAYNALLMCKLRKKTKITYYYDNTSIVNVYRNRKMEYLPEIKRYKGLLEQMYNEGYEVTFVELHPKTDEGKDSENKALIFFHNTCDAECRNIADIFKKDYKAFAVDNSKGGKTYGQIKEEFKPKGKPRNGGNNNYRGGGNNYHCNNYNGNKRV